MKVSIIGSGAYGLALGKLINANKHLLTMWTFDEKEQNALDIERKSIHFKEYNVPKEIVFTMDLEKAIKDSELIIIAVPGGAFSIMSKKLKEILKENQHILIATKGIDNNSGKLFSNILKEDTNSKNISVMSGPTFAEDIIKGTYLAFTLATDNMETAKIVREAFESDKTKISLIKDKIGIQVLSALKNVVAIGSGILSGMEETPSAKALYLTKAFNDIKKLIENMNGTDEAVLSYAGFGDYLMTTTSSQSRNYTYGFKIGSNDDSENYLSNTTVEGVYTLKAVYNYIKNNNINIELINILYEIIFNKKEKENLLKYLVD